MLQCIVLACVIFSLLSCGSDISTKKNPNAYKKGEVIVKFKSGVYETSKYNAHSVLGAKLIKKIGKKEFERVQLPEEISVEQAIAEYETNPDVEYAEPNYIVRAFVIPNDPRFNELWGLYNTGQTVNNTAGTAGADISVIDAWDILHDSSAIVAVLDTGIDSNHPDMSANLIQGYDFVDKDNSPKDLHGHGTHCSGIISSVTNNGIGVAGIACNCKIMPVCVSNDKIAWLWNVLDGIAYAADNGADVISMSFGNYISSDMVKDVLDDAYSQGSMLVAAAGNEEKSLELYPAGYDNVIAVVSNVLPPVVSPLFKLEFRP